MIKLKKVVIIILKMLELLPVKSGFIIYFFLLAILLQFFLSSSLFFIKCLVPELICSNVISIGLQLINLLLLELYTIFFIPSSIIIDKHLLHGAESCNLLFLSHRTT